MINKFTNEALLDNGLIQLMYTQILKPDSNPLEGIWGIDPRIQIKIIIAVSIEKISETIELTYSINQAFNLSILYLIE